MKRASVIVVVVLVALGLGWWLLSGPDTPTPDAPNGEATRPGEAGFVLSPVVEGEVVDAGVGRVFGVVLDEVGAPVPSAKVRLFASASELERLECGVCHEHVFSCTDPSTVKLLIDAVRGRSLTGPKLLAERMTSASGEFDFGETSLDGQVVVVVGSRVAEAPVSTDELTLVLEPARRSQLMVVDATGEPLSGVEVSVYSPREGTLTSVRSDEEGNAAVEAVDPQAWVFAEKEGSLPAGAMLEYAASLTLSPPRTLVVHTRLGAAPIDAEVTIPLHGGDQKLRTKGGTLRLENLPTGFYLVSVATEEFSAAAQSAELFQPVTELEFQLRKSAKLVVSLLSSSGDPIEHASGSLNGEGGNVDAEAEHGALLILGPVPEGEFLVTISSEGMVPISRPVDLKPGENNLELTLRPAPKLRGTVKRADGKPAVGAQVHALEEGQDVVVSMTDEQGEFELEFQYPGAFELRAEGSRDGIAEAKATVPGPPVTLTLDAKGVLEVEVFDEDGSRLTPDLLVRGDNVVRWIEPEGEVGRVAGLHTGSYVLEKTIPERVPLSAKAEVVEGRVTRVTLRARVGATVSGQVLDADGKPVVEGSVLSGTLSANQQTDADGRFVLKGLEPEAVELFAVSSKGVQSERVKVVPPATGVVLTLPRIQRARGRVVDEHGAPLTTFDVNAERVNAADGRFDVEPPNASIDVWAEGHVPVFINPAVGELGDVVLKRQPVVEGVVVDAEGGAVGGATVMGSADMATVTTDGRGRFKLDVTSEAPQELIATRGGSAGRAPLVMGQPARIELRKGTVVSGRVLDAQGKPVQTLVKVASTSVSSVQEIDTDEAGRFQLPLAQGIWAFSTRSNRLARSVEVSGERMEVVLGEQAQCSAIVRAARPIDGLWFIAGNAVDVAPWEEMGRTAGSLEYPVSTPAVEVQVRGVPCGKYALSASIESIVTTIAVDLQGPGQVIVVATPEVAPREAPLPPEDRAP